MVKGDFMIIHGQRNGNKVRNLMEVVCDTPAAGYYEGHEDGYHDGYLEGCGEECGKYKGLDGCYVQGTYTEGYDSGHTAGREDGRKVEFLVRLKEINKIWNKEMKNDYQRAIKRQRNHQSTQLTEILRAVDGV